MTGRKRGLAYNPNKTPKKRQKRASVPDPSPHPHGDFDEGAYYQLRNIVRERVTARGKKEYLIDWEDDARTGEKYDQTWEPKENVNELALKDWRQKKKERAKSTSEAGPSAETRRKSSSTQETPVKAPVKRSKPRTVIPSSSLSQKTPATKQRPASTPNSNSTRPLEIEESPEASTTAASQQDDAEDSLFIPLNFSWEPSQDRAVVQPSDPPSSYQNYEAVKTSQSTTSLLQSGSTSQAATGPDFPHSPEASQPNSTDTGEVSSGAPAVFATSQNAPSQPQTSAPGSTGRIVPDSQSLPTSLYFHSQTQHPASPSIADGDGSQLVDDLQVAANATATPSHGQTNHASQGSQAGLSQDNGSQRHLSPAVDDLDTAEPQPLENADTSQKQEFSGKSQTRPQEPEDISDESQRAILVASDSSQAAPAYDFSSQINFDNQEQQFSPAANSPTIDQPTETADSGESFPFETQIAPAQAPSPSPKVTPAKPLPLPHTQPTGQQQDRTPQNVSEVLPRASSLPVQQDESSWTPFPSIPAHSLPTIGESAPPPPDIPSTPIRSIEDSDTMDQQPPTSEPAMSTADEVRAMKARNAERRAQAASSATPAKLTPAKPSAVPQRLNAELAAESPARIGSPESSRNGGRSPSAVPAVRPVQIATQEEMTTSERYKTLLPQEKEDASLRRQSIITGTTSKEASKVGNFVHSVPIAIMGHQRDSYPTMLQQNKDLIEQFLGTTQPSEELMIEVETLLERLHRIVVHPDLDNAETYTQYDVPPASHAGWAVDCSAKFRFLKQLIDELKEKELSIAVICQSGQLLQIVETFLLGFNIAYYRADNGQAHDHDGCALKVKILSSNEGVSSESLAADAVICMDNSAEAGSPTLKLLQDKTSSDLVMMTLIVPGTIEHVERCLSPNLTRQQKLRALVHGVYDLRYQSGKLEHGQLPSLETAKVIADYMTSSTAEREWSIAAVTQLENLDSQTESEIEPPPSLDAAHAGDKRSFDATADVAIPASDTFKRPRLDTNGAPPPDQPITINPLDLDITHVSDSIKPSSTEDPHLAKTNERLQALLLSAQARLSEHEQALSDLQYRHEDQRAQLIELGKSNEEAIETAQKAVSRMSEGAAATSTLRADKRALQEQLKAAQDALADHSVPERAELEKLRIELAASHAEKAKLEQRLKTQQGDLDYVQEMYQNTSSAAQHLGTTNKELENQLAHAMNRASAEQGRARQMTLDMRAQLMGRENAVLKARVAELTATLSRKDKELGVLKEATRGRMGTRGTSVPRSPRMGSPLKTAAAGGGSRQGSPSAGEGRGRVHPLSRG